MRKQSPEIYLKLCSDLLPRDLAATLDPAAQYRNLETPQEVYAALAAAMVSDDGVAGSLDVLDQIRSAVLAHGAEMAGPID